MRTGLDADGRLPEAVAVAQQTFGSDKRQAALANYHFAVLQHAGSMAGSNTDPKPATMTPEISRRTSCRHGFVLVPTDPVHQRHSIALAIYLTGLAVSPLQQCGPRHGHAGTRRVDEHIERTAS